MNHLPMKHDPFTSIYNKWHLEHCKYKALYEGAGGKEDGQMLHNKKCSKSQLFLFPEFHLTMPRWQVPHEPSPMQCSILYLLSLILPHYHTFSPLANKEMYLILNFNIKSPGCHFISHFPLFSSIYRLSLIFQW